MKRSDEWHPRVVLCGSMRHLDLMDQLASRLEQKGVEVVTPRPDSCVGSIAKRAASLRHFREIRRRHTDAILVVNSHREHISSYIGPNSFAEIAIAFVEGKRIFVLNGFPGEYADELTAWGAINLGGDLTGLLIALANEVYSERRTTSLA